MGGAASSDKYLAHDFDHDNAQELAGEHWDEAKWEKLAVEGKITRTQLSEAATAIGLSLPLEDKAAVVIQKTLRGRDGRRKTKAALSLVRATKRIELYERLGVPDDELKVIRQCFARYDVGNNNWISPQQLQNAIVDLEEDTNAPNDHQIVDQGEEFSTLFRSIDRDGNQQIEAGEFMKWWMEGGDDMDSNFMKWWFKRRWAELAADPDFLASPVKEFVQPESEPEVEQWDNPMTAEEIKQRQHITPTTNGLEVSPGLLSVNFAALSQRGYYPEDLKKKNQDAYTVIQNFCEQEHNLLFGVFDGHGQKGTYCARFVRDNLALNVQQALKLAVDKSEVSMHDAFVAGHQFTDKQMHCKKDRMSGTTAVCVMMQGTTVHVSNVGDSRAVLGHRDRSSNRLQACALTFDQTPYRKDERERCKKTGARVMNMDQLDGIVPLHDNWDVKLGEELDDGGDPPRIWHRTERYPGTAFTRSLGDQMAIPWGVIPDPEMLSKELHPDDELLIIASDGIWEFITNQEAVDIVDRYEDPLEACKHLVAEAYKMWMIHDVRTDDITVINIHLKWQSKTDHSESLPDHVQGGIAASPRTLRLQSQQVRPVRRGMSKAKRKHLEQLHATCDKEDDPPFLISEHQIEMTDEETDTIRRAVRGNYLFGHLNEAQLAAAISCMEKAKVQEGEIVIKQGDDADYYFVANSGEYDVHIRDVMATASDENGELVHTYSCDQSISGHTPSFGELGLLHKNVRAATVVCKVEGQLWRLSKQAFRNLLLRTEHRALVGVLQRVKILHSLHGNQLCRLADLLTEVPYQQGEKIISEGSVSNDFFIIKTGAVKVLQNEKEIMTLKRYDYFNEQSLAEEAVETHTYIASEATVCLHIERDDFEHLLGHLSDLISDHAAKRIVSHDIRANLVSVDGDDVSSLSFIRRISELNTDVESSGGGFGFLSLSRHVDHPEHLFAMRTVSKSRVVQLNQLPEVLKEKEIIKSLGHLPSAFFPDVIATFSDKTTLYTLYATLVAFDLNSFISTDESAQMVMSEDHARFYVAALFVALQAAHENALLCRCIDTESIFLDQKGYPHLLDFRFSKMFDTLDEEERTFTMCGTPDYFAPEIIGSDGHGYAVDYWSLGILLFELLVGTTPFANAVGQVAGTGRAKFKGDMEHVAFDSVLAHEYDTLTFPDGANISTEGKSMINSLLNPNATARYNFAQHQARTHPWFAQNDNGSGIDWQALKNGTVPSPHKAECEKAVDEMKTKGPLEITPFGDRNTPIPQDFLKQLEDF